MSTSDEAIRTQAGASASGTDGDSSCRRSSRHLAPAQWQLLLTAHRRPLLIVPIAVVLLLIGAPLASAVHAQSASEALQQPVPAGNGQTGGSGPVEPDPADNGADGTGGEGDTATEEQVEIPFGLELSGDFRLRYEGTTKQKPGAREDLRDPRHRAVIRFRAGITKRITEVLTFGARLATGSSDDPNTTDVTLGDFVNDAEVSLDRVYLELAHRNLFLAGGKFANPFLTTELVWDGDVNPQGAAAAYTLFPSRKVTPTLTAMYGIVDEQTTNPDSYMWATQLQVAIDASPDLSLTLGGAYYDYTIRSLTNADAGDTLSNRLTPDRTAYLSDFNLLDAIAIVQYSGGNPRYPVRVVGDYVRNLGADTAGQGFGVDVFVGRSADRNDRRYRYGFAKAETDAVLAAFSHDNTTLATNYLMHTFGIESVVHENATLDLTWYVFRADDVSAGSLGGSNGDYLSRLRLNVVVRF